MVASIPSIRSAQRNNVEIQEESLPCVVVFDSDEETAGADDRSARLSTRPYVTRMTPEIVLVQQNAAVSANLAVFRRELIKRVLTDAALIGHVGGNGAIRYVGCTTDFGWLREKYNAMSVQFMFQYSLKIEEL